MLLFFDIDGTIFDDERRMPASVRPSLEEASRRGHHIIINTGRTLCNTDHRLDDLPLDGWIMGCGTRILWHGETLSKMEYSPEDTLRLRNVFLELQIPVVYECDTGMYFDPEAPHDPKISGFREWARIAGIAREVSQTDPEFRAVKMFCFSEDEELIGRMKERTAAIGMPYTAIRRARSDWEVVPVGYDKGSGIDRLREALHVPLEDCYAFGDSTNDLAMLRHVEHSIAMGNAQDAVKAVCSYVTDRPENDGIAKALRHFQLIGA